LQDFTLPLELAGVTQPEMSTGSALRALRAMDPHQRADEAAFSAEGRKPYSIIRKR
jgi:hypothetical protein